MIAAILRDPELRRPYLQLFLVRVAVVGFFFVFPATSGSFSRGKQADRDPHVVISRDPESKKPGSVHVDLPGLYVHIDETQDASAVKLLGQNVPVHITDEDRQQALAEQDAAVEPAEPPVAASSALGRGWHRLESGWQWILAALAFLSFMEGAVVFFSRRWDDWLSHYGARLVGIRPEDAEVRPRKLAIELGWLYRKTKRKIRGYFQFAVGLPLLLPLRAIPGVGNVLFALLAAMWGWYWLGVFTAGKSAHAWGDHPAPPIPVRVFTTYVPQHRITAPVRWYGRTMHWITRDTHAAACTFERSPAAFLGLGFARMLLALPGLYFLARPIVPLAAGRLCAESDPERGLWAK